MQRHSSSRRRFIVIALIGASVLACTLQTAAPVAAPESPSGSVPESTAAAPTAPVPSLAVQPTEAATATATATATQGPPLVVTINAVGGRLNVRRGPGPEYDTVGAFRDGQSSVATARNAESTWVLINVPDSSKSLGWITLETKYTTVTGAVPGLPSTQVGPAAPAYIRNCTGREMLINPLGQVLLPRGSAPKNQQQFFPGEYSVVDMETETAIADVTVFEGKTIDIREDSSGRKFSCP